MRFFLQAYSPRNMKFVAINACVIPGVFAYGYILVHELGHFLLAPEPSFLQLDADGHSKGSHDLMQANGLPEDIKIPEAQANWMNLSGWD
jgi:Zn-dependent peptidase ImmA (M78 family)